MAAFDGKPKQAPQKMVNRQHHSFALGASSYSLRSYGCTALGTTEAAEDHLLEFDLQLWSQLRHAVHHVSSAALSQHC